MAKVRSPAYPAIDLETAIERARVLYQHEHRHAAPVNVVLEHWDYSNNSGPGMQALAALKYFGLTEDSGKNEDRSVKLSALALDILEDEVENSESRQAAIKQAAIMPKVYADLWAQYKAEMPSDGSIKTYLIRQKNFNPSAVDAMLKDYRATISFAKLSNSATLPDDGGDKNRDGDPPGAPPGGKRENKTDPLAGTVQRRAGMKHEVSTVGDGEATLQWPSELTEAGYEDLKDWLELVLKKIKRSMGEPKRGETAEEK